MLDKSERPTEPISLLQFRLHVAEYKYRNHRHWISAHQIFCRRRACRLILSLHKARWGLLCGLACGNARGGPTE